MFDNYGLQITGERLDYEILLGGRKAYSSVDGALACYAWVQPPVPQKTGCGLCAYNSSIHE